MRKCASFVVSAVVLGFLALVPAARADNCHGDLYCDGRDPGECEVGGIVIPCAAGDASVDSTLLP
jgi:hypothetical protein